MVLGCNIDELSVALFDETLHESIRAIISGAKSTDTQIRRSPDGCSFEIKLYPLIARGIEGASIHCIMVFEDISERLAYDERSDKQKSSQALACYLQG